MGARIALNSAPPLHDSNGWPVSLEFSLAALFPSRTGDLCGGSIASKTGITNSGYSGARTCRLDRRRSVDLPHSWRVRFSAHLDYCWTGCGLGLFGNFPTQFGFSIVDARRDHVLRLPRHISLRPDELWSAALQFFSRTA